MTDLTVLLFILATAYGVIVIGGLACLFLHYHWTGRIL